MILSSFHRGHIDVVWCMITRKGCLYSCGADGIVKIWNLEQLAKGCTGNILAHKSMVSNHRINLPV